MKPTGSRTKTVILYVLMAMLAMLPIMALFYAARPMIREVIADNANLLLTDEARAELYERLASEFVGIYEPVPEPHVGKLLQRNISKSQRGAEVVANNAGLRSSRPYVSKEPGSYRIVCLGDSFVEGTGGREEDRFCNQIEDILLDAGFRPGGRTPEAYAIGVGSWTALNAATYLTSRLSAYDPDLIIALLVNNDIADTQVVSGIGTASNHFSSETRSLGSGVFLGGIPPYFGVPGSNLLKYDLAEESRRRWAKAFSAYGQLEELQVARGGKMLLSSLDAGPYFNELARLYKETSGVRSPLIIVDYEGERLPHDAHPNREGHRILAAHHLHTLLDLGWIDVETSRLPPRPSSLDQTPQRAPAHDVLTRLRNRVARQIPERMEFEQLDEESVRALLGGVWPGAGAEDKRSAPYGSLKSGFLLRRIDGTSTVNVTIETPPAVELYPLNITLHVDGEPASSLNLRTAADAGEHTLRAPLPAPGGPAIEVTMYADAYWTEIDDATMKSYRFVAAWQD